MHGFVINIEKATKENTDFRRVLYTTKNSQLVEMALLPGEEIGAEVHQLDQFLRIEQGVGKAVLDGVEHAVSAEWSISVPAGAEHNIINTGNEPLKLYTVYSPPNHQAGTIHATKAEAEASAEQFDGITTE